jgi:hypothetical protein
VPEAGKDQKSRTTKVAATEDGEWIWLQHQADVAARRLAQVPAYLLDPAGRTLRASVSGGAVRSTPGGGTRSRSTPRGRGTSRSIVVSPDAPPVTQPPLMMTMPQPLAEE